MQNKEHIFLASPHMSDEGYEQDYIKEAFDTNWIAPLGKNVNEFEKEMAEKLGVRNACALSCGTAAIHLALLAAGVKPGDKVFCQSLTFSATANPITYVGAEPVFIDSDRRNWMMSPDALREAFRQFPGTKVVIAVHLYGIPALIDEIKAICDENKAVLIEDAAESLGSKYHGKYTGTFGEYSIISFNGNKIITSSGGGMLLFNGDNADEKKEKVLFWATQSREKARHYQHNEIGYNYRMSNIVAGIGRGQLKVLDKRVEQKQKIYEFYKELFSHLDGIEIMPIPDECDCNCWLTAAQLHGKIRPIDLILALEEDNIESRPIWKPLHLQPVFSQCAYIDNGGIAQRIFDNGICLPSDTKMTADDLSRIADVFHKLWSK